MLIQLLHPLPRRSPDHALGGQGVAQQMVEQGYQKGGEAKQQIQQQQNQQEQDEQQSDSSESAGGDGQKLEAPRLRREY